MADDFAERYGDLLTGSYDCVDRIVLNAYFSIGHDPGGFRCWWRRVHDGSDERLDDTRLMRMAGRFARRVNLVAGLPAHWRVPNGAVVDVFADSVEGLEGPGDERDYTFSNLMDIRPDGQGGFDITARTPANPADARIGALPSYILSRRVMVRDSSLFIRKFWQPVPGDARRVV